MNEPILVWHILLNALQFAAFLAITRCARGPLLTVLSYGGYLALRGACTVYAYSRGFTHVEVIADGFFLNWLVFAALVQLLSDGYAVRRLFKTLVYGAYSAAYIPLCQALAVRWHPALGPWLSFGTAYAIAIAAHVVFIAYLLPAGRRVGEGVSWTLPSCIAAGAFALLHVCGLWPNALMTGTLQDDIIFASAALMTLALFPLCMRYFAAYHEAARMRLAQDKIALLTADISARRQALDEARRIRHDRRHDRIAVLGMLNSHQYDHARRYLEELNRRDEELRIADLIWCEDETVNAVLSGYAAKAKVHSVAFQAWADIAAPLPFRGPDLVTVLANLLENAINAAGKGGFVECHLKRTDTSLAIFVSNNVPPNFRLFNGLPCRELGVGLGSVHAVLTRHNGYWSFELAEGRLICRVQLSFPKVAEAQGVRGGTPSFGRLPPPPPSKV